MVTAILGQGRLRKKRPEKNWSKNIKKNNLGADTSRWKNDIPIRSNTDSVKHQFGQTMIRSNTDSIRKRDREAKGLCMIRPTLNHESSD